MIRTITAYLRKSHDNLRQTDHIYMVLVAIVIGLLGGYCSVGFRAMIEWFQTISWGIGAEGLIDEGLETEEWLTLSFIRQLPWYWKVTIPAVGGLIVGLIIHYFASEAKGHGVPEVMESVALRGGRIRPRVVIAKMLASGVCIASGGSVGREGPIVQIGSTIGSTVGQWLRIDERRLRTLVGCGAAAGIAGTFNAPVAGALFAVEVILTDFGVSQFSPIVISSVAATVISRHHLGDFPAFIVPSYDFVWPELLAYAVLGILAGLVALTFIKVLYGAEDLFDRLPGHQVVKAICGGAIIGVIALKWPEIYGVGYEAINLALKGDLAGMIGFKLMLILVIVKICSVAITIGSGGSGGIFAPSLFIGAMLGGAVGVVVEYFWPGSTGGPGAYALVGMGAVVAAGTHAPITAILIIFELTSDYEIILPLMTSCIIATLLTTRLQKASIYTLKLLRRGVDIRGGRDINVLRHLLVRDVMREDIQTISPDEALMPVMTRFINSPDHSLYVAGPNQELMGVIAINDIRPVLTEVASLEFAVIARDMMIERDFPTVSPDDNLDDVMKRLGMNYRGEVPVVEQGRVIGAIWPEDVIERYNVEIFKRDMAYGMASAMGEEAQLEPLRGVEGMSVAEIPAPARFIGKTVIDLNIRKRFDVSVLLIKRKSSDQKEWVSTFPDAEYVFQPGDVMLVMGPTDRLRRLERIS